MPIESGDEHGVLRGEGVDKLLAGMLFHGPSLMVPISTQYPLASGEEFGSLLYETREFLSVSGCAEVNPQQHQSGIHKMGVGVNKTGED